MKKKKLKKKVKQLRLLQTQSATVIESQRAEIQRLQSASVMPRLATDEPSTQQKTRDNLNDLMTAREQRLPDPPTLPPVPNQKKS